MRRKVLELRSFGIIRYDDVVRTLNAEGIPTRRGKAWTLQSVARLMRAIGLMTGKVGRRGPDE